MLRKLPWDIKLQILTFITTRKNFNYLEKEITELYDSMEDRGYVYCMKSQKKIREIEELLIILKFLEIIAFNLKK